MKAVGKTGADDRGSGMRLGRVALFGQADQEFGADRKSTV